MCRRVNSHGPAICQHSKVVVKTGISPDISSRFKCSTIWPGYFVQFRALLSNLHMTLWDTILEKGHDLSNDPSDHPKTRFVHRKEPFNAEPKDLAEFMEER